MILQYVLIISSFLSPLVVFIATYKIAMTAFPYDRTPKGNKVAFLVGEVIALLSAPIGFYAAGWLNLPLLLVVVMGVLIFFPVTMFLLFGGNDLEAFVMIALCIVIFCPFISTVRTIYEKSKQRQAEAQVETPEVEVQNICGGRACTGVHS